MERKVKGNGIYTKYQTMDTSVGLLLISGFLKYVSEMESIQVNSEALARGGISLEAAEKFSDIFSEVTGEHVPINEFMKSSDEYLERISEHIKERDSVVKSIRNNFGINKEELDVIVKDWKEALKEQDSKGGFPFEMNVLILSNIGHNVINSYVAYLNDLNEKERLKRSIEVVKSVSLLPKNILAKIRRVVHITAKVIEKNIMKIIPAEMSRLLDSDSVEDIEKEAQTDKRYYDSRNNLLTTLKTLLLLAHPHREMKTISDEISKKISTKIATIFVTKQFDKIIREKGLDVLGVTNDTDEVKDKEKDGE